MTSEAQRLERLAERLRAVDPVAPSPGAKIRGWNLVLAAVERSATVRSRVHPVRRLVIAAVAATVLLVAGAVAASAESLPDSAFYPLKGVIENVRGALAFSPSDKLAYHLDLAQARLTEAEAMLAGLQGQVTNPTALSAIIDARYHAAQALRLAAKPAASDGHGNPAGSPSGNGQGNGTSATPHPTPKH